MNHQSEINKLKLQIERLERSIEQLTYNITKMIEVKDSEWDELNHLKHKLQILGSPKIGRIDRITKDRMDDNDGDATKTMPAT